MVALTLLGAIAFTFLHSELGFLNFDGDNHGAHDYCEIVKNINTQTKTINDKIPKLELTKILCNYCFHVEETSFSNIVYGKIYQHINVRHSTDTYLFNNIFLI